MQKATEIKKDDSDSMNTLGLILFDNQWYENALEKFQKAIDLDDSKADYYTNKALALFHLGFFQEAELLCDKTKSMNPENARNHHTDGII